MGEKSSDDPPRNEIIQTGPDTEPSREGHGEPPPKAQQHQSRRRYYCGVAKKGWVVFWEGIDKPAERIIALGTCVLALVGIIALSDTKGVLETSQRAWIAPMGVMLNTQPQIDQVLSFRLLYVNTGKEPALSVGQNKIVEFTPLIKDENGEVTITPNPNTTCNATHVQKGAHTVYPSVVSLTYYWDMTTPFKITTNILDSKDTFYINGCFAYVTFEHEHKSGYCLFLRKSPQTGWDFQFCPSGNSAD